MQGMKTGRYLITFQDSGLIGDTENHSGFFQFDYRHHLSPNLYVMAVPGDALDSVHFS